MAPKNSASGKQPSAKEIKEAYSKIAAIYDSFELELERIRKEKNCLLAAVEKRLNDEKIKAAMSKLK